MTIIDRELVITQLADDTTLFLQNKNQIPIAIKVIEEFSKASGVYLNVKKCELVAVKECSVAYCNIPVKTEVKYLAIIISKNQQNTSSFSFNPIIQKTMAFKRFVIKRKSFDFQSRGYVLTNLYSYSSSGWW